AFPGPFGTGGVDLASVEARALLGIADDVVGGGNALEPLRGLGITRVQIGMELLGELAIGRADLVLRGVPFHSQGLIRILGHSSPHASPARQGCAQVSSLEDRAPNVASAQHVSSWQAGRSWPRRVAAPGAVNTTCPCGRWAKGRAGPSACNACWQVLTQLRTAKVG